MAYLPPIKRLKKVKLKKRSTKWSKKIIQGSNSPVHDVSNTNPDILYQSGYPIPIRISYTNPHNCLHTCVKNLPIFIFYLDFRVKTYNASIAFFVENTLFQWSSLRSIIPSNGVTWLNSRYRVPDLSRFTKLSALLGINS